MQSFQMSSLRKRTGRIIGQVSALLCAIPCLAFAVDVWVNHPHDREVVIVLVGLSALATIAWYAARKSRPILLVALFAVSFLPVGLYLALHPHWVRWAGLAPIGYLIAAWLIGHRPKLDLNSLKD